ncbi:MAG: glutamine--tRNA ligase/YqeY domain fusion protein [Anaerolineae bacterium]|nr:glutamine--tRNA ligase/YqeY domain fusion protein [Anaerolineae bacterium]
MTEAENKKQASLADEKPSLDFIRAAVEEDIRTGRFGGRVHTRFPPEPNGYLHIGHAKAICITYGVAEDYSGKYNLRFDDTNPAKEEVEYADSMIEDIRWLGFDVGDHNIFYASDYFEQLYTWAEEMIQKGLAYVDDLSPDEIREYRGTLTEPGKNSPYRNRSIEENLDLFRRMRAGEFPEGACVLRAKIDMASPNINMRDPVMYRILHREHYRAGAGWCVYPMYDWAHGLEDSIEGITHSLCDMGYEDHRPLYDWFLDQLGVYHPQQIEFARLNLNYTMLSKRYLLQLVKEGVVRGWDDPRMPTLVGLRRRGYTSESIRNFCDRIGVSKANSIVDIAFLEACIRDDLNERAPRAIAVLRPLKVIIDNYPEGQVEHFEVPNHPQKPEMGTRLAPFAREIYIEQDDFMENPPSKYFRLSPEREVRLLGAFYIRYVSAVKDADGNVIELHCTYDPESRGGSTPDGRKVKGTIHWVSAAHAVDAELRLYDRLFAKADPNDVPEGQTWTANLNRDSLQVLAGCKVEPLLSDASAGDRFQFMRQGYFSKDIDSRPGCPVFNLTVSLRDSWAKAQEKA